ncbi:MAG: metallophosphoesterase [Bacillota bacterium]|nr:metallophosphoesterase [Bacillota bacterium]
MNRPLQILTIIGILIFIILFLIFSNNSIVITEHNYKNNKIPSYFDGFKILQVSDLHNKKFGENQQKIIEKIEGISPDIILITGDLIDRRKYDLNLAESFINQIVKIAPVYYSSGNHEAWSGKYSDIKMMLIKNEVTVLDNQVEKYYIDNESIHIIGLKDPAFLASNYLDGINTIVIEEFLTKYENKEEFEIVLSHRPELLDLYENHDIDVVFSGHAHGGQIRLPYIGGILAPDQGFFPKYDEGRYDLGSTTMYVSRGLGNSIFPFRIFNRPELVVVNLHK